MPSRLDGGETKNALTQTFGQDVMAAPPAFGFGLVAWLTPIVALSLGLLLVVAVVRRRRSVYRSASGPAVVGPEMQRRIDRDLASFQD